MCVFESTHDLDLIVNAVTFYSYDIYVSEIMIYHLVNSAVKSVHCTYCEEFTIIIAVVVICMFRYFVFNSKSYYKQGQLI